MHRRMRAAATVVLFVACGVGMGTPLGAQQDDERGSTTRRAIRAAQQFLQENPERRADLFPPGPIDLNHAPTVRNGEGESRMLQPFRHVLADFGASLLAAEDADNLRRLYGIVWRQLPPRFREGLPPPGMVNRAPKAQVQQAFRDLSIVVRGSIHEISILQPPAGGGTMVTNPIGVCNNELGWEQAGTDSEKSKRCTIPEYSLAGLMRNTLFPLQDNLTCVKDQGTRGTCSAFATTATVESLTLVTGGPAETLSEQHAYFSGEVLADDDVVDMQLYGVSLSLMLDDYAATGRDLHYESSWNYNRSLSMSSIPVLNIPELTLTYNGSCSANYLGEACSDYALSPRCSSAPTFPSR